MAELTRDEMHRLARLGAQARLEEIRREESTIRRAFPDLFRGSARSGRGASSIGLDNGSATGGRQRAPMSAAMRKAVSIRMKKYWAARRKAKAAAKG